MPPSKRLLSSQLDFPRAPTANPDYLALLDEISVVVSSLSQLRPAVRQAIICNASTSIEGMKRHITSGTTAGEVRLQSADELREYCYFVAGVVGEMLTDIFVEGASWLSTIRYELDVNARWFGEGLQLVNILKDADDDLQDGRVFIPGDVTRRDLFELAREDLQRAEAYVSTLRKANAPTGFVAFTELPLLLATRTLDCVERFGPGSKIPRSDVFSILTQLTRETMACVSDVAVK